MNPIINNNLNQIKQLCVLHKVAKLFVFGSVCTPLYNEKSDIDFIVSFQKMEYGDYADNFFAFAEALENLLHRSVDLVSEKTISNPYFIKEIAETKSLLYAA